MSALAIAAVLAQANGDLPKSHPLDAFMKDVTEACLLPDMDKTDPRPYFAAHGWHGDSGRSALTKDVAAARYSVTVKWPATSEVSASCSFESRTVRASEVYDWFKGRVGEPNDIAWSDRQIAGWKMTTNGHDAGVYLSRHLNEHDKLGGMVLHILQR